MSKKVRKQKKSEQKRQRRNRRKSLVVIALILSLGLTSLILAQWRTIRSSFSSSFSPLTPQPQTSQTPSKEYIYGGGKLIATEEPNATSSNVPAPSGLTATVQFSGQTLTGVLLGWNSPSGTVNHFRVERAQSKDGPWVVPQLNNPGPNDTTFNDTTVSSNIAYLYRICAVDSQGNFSAYSNVDLSTTVYLQDYPFQAGQTPIRAQHFLDLMQAINAVRATAGLAPATWDSQYPQPQVHGGIYHSHLNDLRTALGDALSAMSALGFSRPQYEDPNPMTSGTPVKATQLKQLQDLVR